MTAVVSRLSTPTNTNTDPDPSPEPDSSSSSKSNLSPGAIAGIVIGIVALLAFAGLLFFFLRRRKARQTPTTTTGADMPELVSTDMHTFGTANSQFPSPAKAPFDTTQETTPRTSHQPDTYLPVPTTTTTNTYATESNHRSSDASGVPELLIHSPSPDSPSQRPYSDVPSHSTSQFSSPNMPFASPFASENGDRGSSEVERLEKDKRVLEERIARMRSIAQMEEEQERVRARIEALRSKGQG
jgi:hypothetical protein